VVLTRCQPITGSYHPEDCRFLLKPIAVADIPVAEKERLIQSGQRHYSEMLTHEQPLTPDYRTLFQEQTRRYRTRLAQDILNLAGHIRRTRAAPITLVSLARAGTPIGALLRRALARLGVTVEHYSISIIRDRGIDQQALCYLLHDLARPAGGVVFVDGWTAKGVITAELRRAIDDWNDHHGTSLSAALYVIADPAGVADVSASADDYLIPSGILGACVSGLVSRSILNERIEPGDFHGCVLYPELADEDLSNWFLDEVSEAMQCLQPRPLTLVDDGQRRELRGRAYLMDLRQRFGIVDINHIKPGVLEATRAMLRRVPGLLLLRDPDHPDVAHLRLLAADKGVAIRVEPTMPFLAVALIRVLSADSL